ncbi:crotonase/enoyl-CoA hydratase family protein [Mycolicibacterium aichiense]|uniref:Enoyl-CoA hydratase n=1 Tax=Mycolicibacterium aichiense TaxID=1799 RepID=A0AAD1HQG9_9MYCO|nr:crotonase/enoyl-CoA hydratase family protein [Mycolicibacterium aichiense]MCV7016359.1 crotonase/enoyl-CoA hydratase family protein [Mycolicibacterium aichiense]BBX09868.1 enoyl-CoA hydratase [Mycolicibacterium aichiense]STZ26464.1 enoyl-CoA hydratase, EchA3 [Mycolicibacterium aichiense]
MSGSVSYRKDDAVAVISLDDGKVNVLSPAMLKEINDALDRAEGDNAGAVVIAGNDRVFSGGFDLKVFRSGDIEASVEMLQGGFNLSHRLLSFPKPVVAAITGHAIAMGSFLACSTDHRIAGPTYNFQANEVAIGMVLPYPALEIMRLRLTPSAYQQAVGLAKNFLGETALAGGWVDEIAMNNQVLARAEEAADEFTALNASAHLASKLRARQATLDAMREGIDNIRSEFGM